MDTTENPLLSLSREKQQTLVDLAESDELDNLAESTGLSRRQLLGIGIGLLGSATVGGLSAQEMIQEVKADASTTDSDGNVGLPGDRVDVFAESADISGTLSTDSATIEGHASELIFELDEYTFADETIDISVGQTWDILIFDVMETTTDGSSIEFYFNSASDSHNAITLSGSGSVSSNSASGPQTLVTMQNTDFNQFSGTYFAQSGISGSGGTRQFDAGDEWLLSGTNGQRSQTADLQIESTTADWSGTIYVGVGGGQL